MFSRNKNKQAGKELQVQAGEIAETVSELLKNPGQLTPQQQNELKAVLAAAGIAGSALKAAQAIEKAGDFGDKMHEQTLKMIEEAHAMTAKGAGQGRPAREKLSEAADRLKKIIDQETARREAERRAAETLAAQPITVCRPIRLKKPAAPQ